MEGDESSVRVDVRSRIPSETGEHTPLLDDVSVEGTRNNKYQSFDDVLEGTGVGVFHVVLVLVSGWALASDSVEIQCISFVTPQLDRSYNTSAVNHKVIIHLLRTK